MDRPLAVQIRVADSIAGYDTMVKQCEREIEPIVRDFRNSDEWHNHELCARLQALGKELDPDGSFFFTTQRAVVEARAAL